jgi:DNA-binding response OmpR family regulator
LDERISVMVLGGNPEINQKIETDLEILGYRPMDGVCSEIDIDEIFRIVPDILLVDLTESSPDTLTNCDILSQKNILPPGTTAIGLISDTTVGQVPMDRVFNEIIWFPYTIVELGFRLRRVAYQHQRKAADDSIRIGDLTLSPSSYQVTVKGEPVVFSYKEYQLLRFLITHPDRVFTREKLLDSIWGENLMNGSRTVDVHIRRVRAKIGDIENRYIKTIRGVGYAFSYEEE